MSIIKLYAEEYDPGVTMISNVFIDYFLKDANDAQLKVYLYLVRHISNHKPFEISDIADEYNHTEADVIRSLKYWEQKQVLSLESDAGNNIVGIELHNIDEEMFGPKPTIHMFALPNPASENENTNNEGNKRFSASDFTEMSKDADWAAIKSLAENYLNKTLSSTDLQSLAHIYKDLNFAPSDVDALFEECLSNNKMTMRSIKKVAEEKYSSININPSVSAIMNALGEQGNPTPDELSFINGWLKDMNLELILEGCKKATLATTGNRFKYASGIFNNWKARNIKTIEEMAASEEAFRSSKETAKKTAAKSQTSSYKNNFNDFKQTQYDWDDINRQIGYK